MIRRIIIAVLILALLCGSASAAVLTDVPGSPTQNKGVSVNAKWNEDELGIYQALFEFQDLSADRLTLEKIAEVFEYVYDEGHRPATWYPEETQQEIEEIIQMDPEALYMTEFLRMHADDTEAESDLNVKMQFNITYYRGQPVVIVLGDTTDPQNIVWTALEAKVTGQGVVEFDVPKELLNSFAGKDFLFNLLTIKGEGTWTTILHHFETISNDSPYAHNETWIEETIYHEGEPLPNNFNLVIVQPSDEIRRELEKMQKYTAENHILTWLPEEEYNEACIMWGEGADKLIVSEYVPLVAVDYVPTTGDAIGTIHFASKLTKGQKILTALGLPRKDEFSDEETGLEWVVMPAVVRSNGNVDIIFNQLALYEMSFEKSLLLVFTEPYAG